jgi:hypothetical protein
MFGISVATDSAGPGYVGIRIRVKKELEVFFFATLMVTGSGSGFRTCKSMRFHADPDLLVPVQNIF